jgi:hypothetical protein
MESAAQGERRSIMRMLLISATAGCTSISAMQRTSSGRDLRVSCKDVHGPAHAERERGQLDSMDFKPGQCRKS